MGQKRRGDTPPKKPRRGTAVAPLPMTQAEVEARIAGGPAGATVARRLTDPPAQETTPASADVKPGPVPISKAEMATLRESEVVPEKVRTRIEKHVGGTQPLATAAPPPAGEKPSPKEVPPSFRKSGPP